MYHSKHSRHLQPKSSSGYCWSALDPKGYCSSGCGGSDGKFCECVHNFSDQKGEHVCQFCSSRHC